MVPAAVLDEHAAHAAEVSARFLVLKGKVPDLGFSEIDELIGMRTAGHARQIAGGKVPGVPKARKLAALFGTSDAWLLCGTGAAPGERRVRAAVEAARARRDGVHPAKVPPRVAAGKRRARSGSVADRSICTGPCPIQGRPRPASSRP